MNIIFGNPAGLWMLLGIPALLAIYWLQKTYRTVHCPAMFLLPKKETVNKAGLRFRRLNTSPTLLLQLLTVLVLTWLVSEPRFLREDSVQRVVIVLDSSDSMTAFVSEAKSALRQQIEKYLGFASRHEWIVLESDLETPTRYTGGSTEELFTSLDSWVPGNSGHDPIQALNVARELAGKQGIVLYVSDHLGKLPEAVDLLAVGSPIDNVGFAGLVLEEGERALRWKVLVRNYSKKAQKRRWWIEVGGSPLPESEIDIEARRSLLLKGEFPTGSEKIVLKLSSDRFVLDDLCPIIRPVEKMLHVRIDLPDQDVASLFSRIVSSSPIAKEVSSIEDADLVVSTGYDAYLSRAVIAVAPEFSGNSKGYRRVVPVAENHELLKSLNWKGLLALPSTLSVPASFFSTLVWQGSDPLISFRKGSSPALAFHFNPSQSNASREPSFALLVNRFLQYAHSSVRLSDSQATKRNLELRQKTAVSLSALSTPAVLNNIEGSSTLALDGALSSTEVNSPARPGFFSIQQGERTIFEGAVRFADVLEGDFSLATAALQEGERERDLMIRNSYRDPAEGIWMILLGILCMLTWGWKVGGAR